MNKYICRILVIAVVILTLCMQEIYAGDSGALSDNPVIFDNQTLESAQEMLKNWSKEWWSNEDGNKWAINVDLRNNDDASGAIIGDYLIPSAAYDLGCYEHEAGETWNAWLEIELTGSGNEVYGILHRCVYDEDATNYNPEEHSWGHDTLLYPFGQVVGNVIDVAETAIDTAQEVWDIMQEFGKNFKHNAIGTLCTVVLRGIRTLGDVMQILANMIQTSKINDLTYSYDDLKSDNSETRNIYTNVREKGLGKQDWQQEINVDGESFGFSIDTKIPVMPANLYNIAIGNIDFLDIDFLTVDSDRHAEDSKWMFLRNFATVVIHISIYISATILIVMLILHGIRIVKGSIDNPEEQLEHKKGLQKLFTSLLMLIGSIVIMALCISASHKIYDLLGMNNGKEQPIRVNVKLDSNGGGYSFSTDITGYLRYMSEIGNVDLYAENASYTIPYFILAVTNFITVVVMLFRMIFMLLLGMLGPILATLYAIKKENDSPFNYDTWVKLYISFAAVQIIFAIAYKVILEYVII